MRRYNRAAARPFGANVSVTQFLGNGILRSGHTSLCRSRRTVADCGLGATRKPDRPVPTATGQPLDPHVVALAVPAISRGRIRPRAQMIPFA
jgi:hypothetical protein